MPSAYDFNQLERRVHELERLVDMLQKLAHSHPVPVNVYPPQYNTWGCPSCGQKNPGVCGSTACPFRTQITC